MTRTRDNYQVVGNSIQEVLRDLNFKLQRLADRLDKIEGIRGTASIESDLAMNANTITDLATPSESTNAARLADVSGNFANPAAQVSGITVNGSSSTSMRSDAAPKLADTAVVPASYTYGSFTVDQQGRLTAASSGAAPPSGANPSASVGLTAVNGSAGTFMRSNGAPALSQSISPNWTGTHKFALATDIGTAAALTPKHRFYEGIWAVVDDSNTEIQVAGVFDDGTGNASIDFGGLLSIGMPIRAPMQSVGFLAKSVTTSPYTINSANGYSIFLIDASGGNRTVNLPKISTEYYTGVGTRFYIVVKRIDSSGNTVTIAANAADTIEGAASFTMAALTSYRLINNGGAIWYYV